MKFWIASFEQFMSLVIRPLYRSTYTKAAVVQVNGSVVLVSSAGKVSTNLVYGRQHCGGRCAVREINYHSQLTLLQALYRLGVITPFVREEIKTSLVHARNVQKDRENVQRFYASVEDVGGADAALQLLAKQESGRAEGG